MEKKRRGEFKPSGSNDVLTTALQTPEHSGRVRGVGGLITPTTYFNLPKGKRVRITKAELLARDRERSEEMERNKEEFLSQIAQLKEMINASIGSPNLSDKGSFHLQKDLSEKKDKSEEKEEYEEKEESEKKEKSEKKKKKKRKEI